MEALGLRVAQIEEILKADELEKKKATEIRSEKMIKKITAIEEKEATKKNVKGKGKAVEAELSKAISVTAKATRKRPLEKTDEEIQIEEARDKRIKAEKVYFGKRESRRKIKTTKKRKDIQSSN